MKKNKVRKNKEIGGEGVGKFVGGDFGGRGKKTGGSDR
jgi:hypothetical protein